MESLAETPVTITLLFANIAISIWAMYSNPIIMYKLSEWPYQIVHEKKYYQLITSAFLHANFMHLFFNMFALFTFGTYLESFFINNLGALEGSLYFFLIYFISMLFGSVLSVVFHYNDPQYVAVGASGAVSGIVFSYIIFFPQSMLYVFFIPMPAYIFAFLWLAFSVYGMKKKLGNIGHEAHLGGALGGVISTLILIDGSMRILLSHFNL
ncbi:MAG TPA: rhomboid family intramembrane serine protease [Ignavibacteria bacterium]|nr:rhomboid family intramembrane serine protease [Ignavibacteria bacterium]HQY52952.1 rhomboid family intramembrane serine protease [Ignavibacteria bacterium]HRA99446.1 rhomboid family intramembrane serine protease [Ignavibacteria bacterium]